MTVLTQMPPAYVPGYYAWVIYIGERHGVLKEHGHSLPHRQSLCFVVSGFRRKAIVGSLSQATMVGWATFLLVVKYQQQEHFVINLPSENCYILSLLHIYFRASMYCKVALVLIMAWHRTGEKPPNDDVIKWKHFPRYWPFVLGITGDRWLPRTKASDAKR